MSDHHLYVVMTNPPGPGAGPLLMEAAHENLERDIAVGPLLNLRVAVNGACEFVELEDNEAHGHGPASGVDWSLHPLDDHHGVPRRLGPFLPATQVGIALGRLYGCLIDPGDLEQLPEDATDRMGEPLRSYDLVHVVAEMSPSTFLKVWENCMDIAARELHDLADRAGKDAEITSRCEQEPAA